jgi:hypothetical protein
MQAKLPQICHRTRVNTVLHVLTVRRLLVLVPKLVIILIDGVFAEKDGYWDEEGMLFSFEQLNLI